jgi:hypothetical protein
MKRKITTRETLHFIWTDKTPFTFYGTKGKKTKKQVYQEILGKKARKSYAKEYPYLTKKEIQEIIIFHAENLKTAHVVMLVAPLLVGDLRRANLEAKINGKSGSHPIILEAA